MPSFNDRYAIEGILSRLSRISRRKPGERGLAERGVGMLGRNQAGNFMPNVNILGQNARFLSKSWIVFHPAGSAAAAVYDANPVFRRVYSKR